MGVVAVAAAVASVIVVAGLVGVRLGSMFDEDGDTNSAMMSGGNFAPVAAVREGCRQWQAEGGEAARIPGACSKMSDWMLDQLGRGRMGPHLMWSSPDDLRATCQRWLADDPEPDVSSYAWCDGMITWMRDHMGRWSQCGDWPGWMPMTRFSRASVG